MTKDVNNYFNEEEFLSICRELNAKPHIKEITIRYDDPLYFNTIRNAVETDRRGEVVFCVIRPNSKLIAVTCPEYPEGIFRIPTGGIGHDEDIIKAVHRETMEELGLAADIKEFAGVLKTQFVYIEEKIMFYSYIFVLTESGGKLLEDATDKEISAVRECSIEDLADIAASLNNITGKWKDWGRFRYETTRAVFTHLKNSKSTGALCR